MDALEEGEIESGTEMDNSEEKADFGKLAMQKENLKEHSSVSERLVTTAYRSTNTAGDTSDSNSDVDEDSPLWKQKKQNKNPDRNMDTRASPTLPEYTANLRPNGQSTSTATKKRNNIWGSVLDEQTLTQSMSKSVGVKRNYIDFDNRNVESYDFRNRHEDSRPEVIETEEPKPNPTDIFDKSACGSVGRSIIDYEDTVDSSSFSRKRNRGNKRKFEDDSGERKKGGVFNRLGAKKHQLVAVGEINVSEEMEKDDLVKTIADFLHEPKVELIGKKYPDLQIRGSDDNQNVTRHVKLDHLESAKSIDPERVIETMGKETAIRIVRMTRDVEHAGGMYTFDGTRKRTPGGVFIQLLKQQPEFTKEVKMVIFKEDHDRMIEERKERRKKKNVNRKKKKKKSKSSPGEKSNSRSNSNSRSTSPVSNKSKSREVSDDSGSDDNKEFSFEEELAAARKRIAEEKNKPAKDIEMEDCDGDEGEKENIDHEAEMNDLDEGNVVDVLVDEASID